MAIKNLDKFMGKPIEEYSLEKVLSGNSRRGSEPTMHTSAQSVEGFIYVPSINLYVAKERSLQSKNWNQAHEELHKQAERMLTIPEFFAFTNYLYAQQDSESKRILDDIFKIGILRSEWLDADFKVVSKKLFVHSYHETKNGILVPQKKELLEPCVMKYCYVDLDSMNKQGFPTRKSKKQEYIPGKNIHYWFPRSDNKSVARFDSSSGWALLFCFGVPSNCDPSLGVRRARAKI